MCGRYTQKIPILDLEEQLDIDLPFVGEHAPSYNVAPTQRVLVVTSERPRQLQRMKWGLVPSWAKDMSGAAKMINARAETLMEKPSFKNAFQKRRCLIISDGFYEWQATPTGKKPMHIHFPDYGLMTYAGIWETWRDAEGKEFRTTSLITTEPNELMKGIHDRMPVILQGADREIWLDPDTPLDTLKALLRPLTDGLIVANEASTLVNNARNDGPELLQPPAQQSLF